MRGRGNISTRREGVREGVREGERKEGKELEWRRAYETYWRG